MVELFEDGNLADSGRRDAFLLTFQANLLKGVDVI